MCFCLIHSSRRQPGITGQLCGEYVIKASPLHGLEADCAGAPMHPLICRVNLGAPLERGVLAALFVE